MEVWQILDAAADRIERDGWCQRQSVDGERSCAVGAIGWVAFLYDRGAGEFNQACDLMDAAVGRDVIEWNDAPERTAREVISTLRACAAVERARTADGLPCFTGCGKPSLMPASEYCAECASTHAEAL